MAPQLRIPISAKIEDFEEGMGAVGRIAERTAIKMAMNFLRSNEQIQKSVQELTAAFLTGDQAKIASAARASATVAASWAKAGAGSAARWAATSLINIALVVAAYKSVSSAIDVVKQDLQAMADIADKSLAAGVSPEFWQTFIAGARGAKVSVEDLEDALMHAARAGRDTLNPDWTVWDEGLKKVTDVEKKMVQLRELFSTGQSFTGVQMFRDASDTEGRVRAVLTYMKELETIGARLAALDLSETFFGAKQTDNLRQGKQTITEFADTIQQTASGTHAGALVMRTKEVNEELERAHGQLERAIRPTLDGIAGRVNEIKSAWASVVTILAEAYAIWSKLPSIPAFGRGSSPASMRSGASGVDEAGFVLGNAANAPLPRRRPSDAPKPTADKEEKDTADAFDRATEAIEKNIAALHADAAAVGKTNAEHQQFRVELRLLEAASNDNEKITQEMIQRYAEYRKTMSAASAMQAAGIVLTKEQTEDFLKLSNAIGLAALSADKAKNAFAAMNDVARFAGNQLIDVIDKATQKGAKFGDIMADVLRSVSRELLRAAITGEGAFAKILGASSTTGGVGGLMGLFTASLKGIGGSGSGVAATTGVNPGFAIGGAAEGGRITGPTIVGERGPELFIPSSSGMVVPNDRLTGGGGGMTIGGSSTSINISGSADKETLMVMQAMLAERDKRFIADVASATRELRRRSVRT